MIACSGKVYYDLVKKREEKGPDDVAICVEQLYPFPHKAFAAELKKYPNADRHRLVPGRAAEPGRLVLHPAQHPREHARRPKLGYAGRAASASPAVGYAAPAPGRRSKGPGGWPPSPSSRVLSHQVRPETPASKITERI